jgi:hypothetical protein
VAVMFLGVGRSVGEGIRTKVGTTPGDQGCGSSGVFRPTVGEPAPLMFTTVSTWTDVTDHECATADQVHLSIAPPSDPADAGRPFQLLVYEEPPLSQYALDQLPTPSTPTWTTLEPGPPHPVSPGTTPTNAPVVGDGSFALRLAPGRTQAVAVPLDWEQMLQAQLDAALPASVPSDDHLTVDVVSPMLGTSEVVFEGREPADWTPGPGEGPRRYRTGAQSHVISYANRDSYDATVNTASLPGIHYLLVTWHAAPDTPADRSLDASLTVQTTGTPVTGVPSYTEIDGLLPPAADSRLVDGTLQPPPADSSTTPASAEQDEPLPWRAIGAAAAAVLAIALLALLASQLRGRHRA